MLAPIVTKDMKLFPTRPIPKHNIKNVRSRAQSLNDFGAPQRSRVVPIRQRNSLSVGHLPPQPPQPVVAARSPPKHTSLRKPSTLGAIVEDVELVSDEQQPAHTSDPHIDHDELMVPASPTTSSAPSLDKPKKGGFRKWLVKTLRSRSSSTDDMDATDSAAAAADDDDEEDPDGKGTKRKVSSGSADERLTHRSCPDTRDPKAKQNMSASSSS